MHVPGPDNERLNTCIICDQLSTVNALLTVVEYVPTSSLGVGSRAKIVETRVLLQICVVPVCIVQRRLLSHAQVNSAHGVLA